VNTLESEMHTNPLVSIVIPMYNEEKYISTLIDSINALDYPPEKIEIIIVDGRSTDGSRELVYELTKAESRIKLLDNPAQKTPSGLNVGVKGSSGEVVIILGAHSTLHKDFVTKNVDTIRQENVVCAGGRIVNRGHTYFQRLVGIAMSTRFGMGSAPYRYSKKVKSVDTVMFGAYDRNIFDEIGFFEEKRVISEDAEFNWRIRQAGYTIVFNPEIISYYYPRDTFGKLIKQFFRYGILRVNVLKKHRTGVNRFHILPPLYVLFLLVLIIGGFFNTSLLLIAGGIILLHFLVGAVSAALNVRERFILSLFILPLVYMSMHFSWGMGFFYGIFKKQKIK
jgi:cellulose synthase/poly-beta-1,6-N-acetylglucosamine synthase-like glycosyltransferase